MVEFIFSERAKTADELLKMFYEAQIWEGKTFWEVEPQMEWVEW